MVYNNCQKVTISMARFDNNPDLEQTLQSYMQKAQEGKEIPVKELRKNIPLFICWLYTISDDPTQRKVKGMWTTKPTGWPENVAYCDPNNKHEGVGRPRKQVLLGMLQVIFDRYLGGGGSVNINRKCQISALPASSSMPVLSVAPSSVEVSETDVIPDPIHDIKQRIVHKIAIIEKHSIIPVGHIADLYVSKDLLDNMGRMEMQDQGEFYIENLHKFETTLDIILQTRCMREHDRKQWKEFQESRQDNRSTPSSGKDATPPMYLDVLNVGNEVEVVSTESSYGVVEGGPSDTNQVSMNGQITENTYGLPEGQITLDVEQGSKKTSDVEEEPSYYDGVYSPDSGTLQANSFIGDNIWEKDSQQQGLSDAVWSQLKTPGREDFAWEGRQTAAYVDMECGETNKKVITQLENISLESVLTTLNPTQYCQSGNGLQTGPVGWDPNLEPDTDGAYFSLSPKRVKLAEFICSDGTAPATWQSLEPQHSNVLHLCPDPRSPQADSRMSEIPTVVSAMETDVP